MNRKQLAALWVGIMLIAVMGVFPPWRKIEGHYTEGYGLIFYPPGEHRAGGYFVDVEIDVIRLLIQSAVVVLVCGGVMLTLREKKTGKREPPSSAIPSTVERSRGGGQVDGTPTVGSGAHRDADPLVPGGKRFLLLFTFLVFAVGTIIGATGVCGIIFSAQRKTAKTVASSKPAPAISAPPASPAASGGFPVPSLLDEYLEANPDSSVPPRRSSLLEEYLAANPLSESSDTPAAQAPRRRISADEFLARELGDGAVATAPRPRISADEFIARKYGNPQGPAVAPSSPTDTAATPVPQDDLEAAKAFIQRKRAQRVAQAQEAVPADARPASTSSARGPARATGGTYLGVGRDHWISAVLRKGALVKLEDDSLWQISPLDQMDTMLWLPVSEVVVIESGNALFPYFLINVDDDEKVEAKLVHR